MKLLRTVSTEQIAEKAGMSRYRVYRLLTGRAGRYTDNDLKAVSKALSEFGIRVSAKELKAGPAVSSNPVLADIRRRQEIKRARNTLVKFKSALEHLLS